MTLGVGSVLGVSIFGLLLLAVSYGFGRGQTQRYRRVDRHTDGANERLMVEPAVDRQEREPDRD